MDADPIDVAAADALQALRQRAAPALRTRLLESADGGDRGSRRRVGLLVVVELDHLDGREVSDRLRREPLHQHGAEREVGGDDDIGLVALVVQEPLDLEEVLLR